MGPNRPSLRQQSRYFLLKSVSQRLSQLIWLIIDCDSSFKRYASFGAVGLDCSIRTLHYEIRAIHTQYLRTYRKVE